MMVVNALPHRASIRASRMAEGSVLGDRDGRTLPAGSAPLQGTGSAGTSASIQEASAVWITIGPSNAGRGSMTMRPRGFAQAIVWQDP